MLIKLTTLIIPFILFLNFKYILAVQHDEVRCKCICPDPNVLLEELANTSTKNKDTRKLYIDNVSPQHCNCDWMVLPKLDPLYSNKSKELCPRCECKYESRNLSTIKWVVAGIICVLTCLTGYMVFLIAVEYINGNTSRRSYQEQINEEVSMDDHSSEANQAQSIGSLDDISILPTKNVMNRVNQQQSKWKRQIIEQRKNIYDKHTMLN